MSSVKHCVAVALALAGAACPRANAGKSDTEIVCTALPGNKRVMSMPLVAPREAAEPEWKAYNRAAYGTDHDAECSGVFNQSSAKSEVEWLSSAYEQTGWTGGFPVVGAQAPQRQERGAAPLTVSDHGDAEFKARQEAERKAGEFREAERLAQLKAQALVDRAKSDARMQQRKAEARARWLRLGSTQ